MGDEEVRNLLLKCTICSESFNNPKLLKCFHTFCEECIDSYMDKSGHTATFTFPLCKSNHLVSENGTWGFQPNFSIQVHKNTDADQSDVQLPCDVCGPVSSANHRCTECEEVFCSSCSNAHTKMKVSRHHLLVKIEASSCAGRKQMSQTFCRHHKKEEVKIFCRECDELLCVVCKPNCHDTHISEELQTKAKKVRDELTAYIADSSLEKKLHVLKEERKKLEKQNIINSEIFQIDKKCLSDHEERLHEAITERMSSMSEILQRKYEERCKENERSQQLCREKIESLSCLIALAKLSLQQDNETEIIKNGSSLCMSLKNGMKEYISQFTDSDATVPRLYRKGMIDKISLWIATGYIQEEVKLPKGATLKTGFGTPGGAHTFASGTTPPGGAGTFVMGTGSVSKGAILNTDSGTSRDAPGPAFRLPSPGCAGKFAFGTESSSKGGTSNTAFGNSGRASASAFGTHPLGGAGTFSIGTGSAPKGRITIKARRRTTCR